jgi:predicted nucleic-acid-binding protein
MTGLDTNILVRYVAQDDPVNSPRANLIMNSLSAEDPGWISLTAIAEFAWVLNRKFRVSRADVYSLLDQFLIRPDVVVEHQELVRKAAHLFLKGSAEFTDYLVACSGEAAGCKHTLTFDRKAAKSAGMTLAR